MRRIAERYSDEIGDDVRSEIELRCDVSYQRLKIIQMNDFSLLFNDGSMYPLLYGEIENTALGLTKLS